MILFSIEVSIIKYVGELIFSLYYENLIYKLKTACCQIGNYSNRSLIWYYNHVVDNQI